MADPGGEQPLVSVIVPAHDRPRRTQRALESVAAQSYRPMELVVVDDGSEPPLEGRLALPRASLRRARLLRHERSRGANAARNTGIEASEGKYLAFLDSDDEWLPEKIERQVAGLEASGDAEVSYTGFRLVDEEERVNSVRRAEEVGDLLDSLLREDVVGTFSVVLASRESVRAGGRPLPEMPAWQDWEWYLRLAASVPFEAVADPLAVKHSGQDQLGRDYERKRDGAYPILKRRITELAADSRQARIGVAFLDFKLGYTALVTGRYREARRSFLAAIRGYPREPRFYVYLASAGPHYPWIRDLKRAAVRRGVAS